MAVTLRTTAGDVKIELFCEEEADACRNFIALCASGFYNGLPFHRVIPGFLVQCGDNSATGGGGGSAAGEPVEVKGNQKFSEAFVVGYAEQEKVRSQFFITIAPQPQLNGRYCGFGKVIFGANVVQAMSRVPTLDDHYPISPTIVKTVEIHYNPFAH